MAALLDVAFTPLDRSARSNKGADVFAQSRATCTVGTSLVPRHTSSARSASSSSRTSASVLKYATETRIPIAAAEALLPRLYLVSRYWNLTLILCLL